MKALDDRGVRIYRALLRTLPADFRRRHSREMIVVFAQELAIAKGRGRLAMIAVWTAALADLWSAWPREYRRHLRHRGRVALPDQGRPIMIGSDIRYAWRSLRRQTLGTALVVAMLALGIAANIAVFSLVNGLFFRPFPFDRPDRLVFVNEKAPKWSLDITGVNFPDFDTWRKGQTRFESLAIWDTENLNLADGTNADRVSATVASHELDEVLRVTPTLGRMFTVEEDQAGSAPVTLISDTMWNERFNRDPHVLGRTLKLNGRPHTIIGVLPAKAEAYPGGTRLWVPLQGAQEGQSYSYNVLGRLKPGVTPAQGEEDLLRAHQPIFDTRDKERVVSPFVLPLREFHVRDYRTAATTLAVAVALLLLVACANVAAVMLARALSRRREMGIRVAVGASRWRLLRQLFVENLLLAIVGGVLGLILGQWAIVTLLEHLPGGAPPWARFGVDARVMTFAGLASMATVLVFGWAPALHAVRGDLRSAMHNVANAAVSSQGGRRTLRTIIGVEFALATLLVVCGGFLVRAYERVYNVDPGFTPEGVLTFTIALPTAVYKDDAAQLTFWDRVEARMAALPGVQSAGLVNCPPFGCHWGSFYLAEGQPPRSASDGNPVVVNRVATPAYFATMGVTLKAGRVFEHTDGRGGPDQERVVIINETFAKTFLPAVENPIGRRIKATNAKAPWNRVVGLVKDIKHYGLERPMRPGVYWPLPQWTSPTMAVALKTTGDPESLIESARVAIRALDPELPLFNVRTMDTALGETMAVRTTYSWMLGVFALSALVLALGGAYGVSSYLVTQRTREFGIRVALGAGRSEIIRGVLHTSLAVASVGVVAGVAASLGVGRLMESLLFGVQPHDVLILTGAAGVILTAALLANLLPARRAARVDPMTSLRAE